MNLKKVKYLIYALCGALFVTTMAAYLLQSVALGVIAAGLCVACIAVNLALWRCPYCGKHPGQVDVRIKFCPHCGKELEDFK